MNAPIGPTYEFPELRPRERLWNLVLYIADKSTDDPNFGKTKLAKILFFTDFQSFIERGQPVSGAAYRKLEFGPVPAPLFELLDRMTERDAISIERAPFYGREQHRIVARQTPDLSIFSGEDIETVQKVLSDLRQLNATDVSTASHGIAWSSTPDGDLIPYQTAWLSDEALTNDEIAHLLTLAEKYGEAS